MKIWAHRGSHDIKSPLENTMAAFQRAIDEAADGIELDVHLSADGVPFVFHDATLTRLIADTDPRPVIQIGWSELSEISLLDGSKIPRLDDVLSLVAGRMEVNIELKDAQAVDTVAPLLGGSRRGWTMLSSFSFEAMRHAHKTCPDVPRAWIAEQAEHPTPWVEQWDTLLERFVAVGSARWHVDTESITPELVALAQRDGVTLHVWTVNDVAVAQRLRRCAVAGIFCDRPGAMRDALVNA